MAETPSPEDGGGIAGLSLIVYEGRFDRVHYALAMASAAAAIGRPVTVFFTMEACRALAAPDAHGRPGWSALPVAAGETDAPAVDAGYARNGIGTFEELLEACVAFDVTFMVCEMGLRARGLDRMTLRDDVPVTKGGIVTFLNDAHGQGAVVFI